KGHGLLNGEVCWLGTLEDAVHIVRGTPINGGITRPVGHEAADGDPRFLAVDRGEALLRGEVYQPAPLPHAERVTKRIEAVGALAPGRFESRREVRQCPYVKVQQ